jgi:hypothetical protein
MAHFAEIDETNTVIRVLVIGDDNEHRGQEFLADDLGFGGTWIKTSYNTLNGVHVDPLHRQPDGGTPLRENYASISSVYDPIGDRFSQSRPFDSWMLGDGFVWEAPTPMPDDGAPYVWDEDTTSWVEITE